MLLVYPAIFHKEENSYWVEIPDLDGCNTYADTIEDAISFSQDALGLYAATILEQGGTLPKSSDIQKINTQDGCFSSLISCDVNAYIRTSKAVKKTLTIPDWLNELATEKGVNFSQTLQNALMEQLNMSSKN